MDLTPLVELSRNCISLLVLVIQMKVQQNCAYGCQSDQAQSDTVALQETWRSIIDLGCDDSVTLDKEL